MSETRTKHDIWVELLTNGNYSNTATIHAATYPDGSPKNSLGPDELREVAEMLDQAADDMESQND